jgi:hypothetical protein
MRKEKVGIYVPSAASTQQEENTNGVEMGNIGDHKRRGTVDFNLEDVKEVSEIESTSPTTNPLSTPQVRSIPHSQSSNSLKSTGSLKKMGSLRNKVEEPEERVYFEWKRDMKNWTTFKPFLWDLIDNPSSSRPAQVISLVMLFFILMSTLAFILESLPQFNHKNEDGWNILEDVFISFFTLE